MRPYIKPIFTLAVVFFLLATSILVLGRNQTDVTAGLGGTALVLSRGDPANVDPSALATLASLPRASTVSELTNMLGPATAAIVVDKSAWDSVPSAFLQQQADKGLSIIALNVPLPDLIEKSGYAKRLATVEARPGFPSELRGLGPLAGAPSDGRGFYSFVRQSNVNGMPIGNSGQHNFSDNLFSTTLARMTEPLIVPTLAPLTLPPGAKPPTSPTRQR